MEYEIFYLIGDTKKGAIDAIKKRVEAMIEAEGGVLQQGEFVDERRMEYAIRGERRGTYIARRFVTKDGAGDIPGVLMKRLSLEKEVLRSIVVRAENLPTLEESQDRVRRTAAQRPTSYGRARMTGRPRVALPPTPPLQTETTPSRDVSDQEIDENLGKVLHI